MRIFDARSAVIVMAVGVLFGCTKSNSDATSASADAADPDPAVAVIASSTNSAAEAAVWPLMLGQPDMPGLITALARCGSDFFLVDRRFAVIYRTDLQSPGQRIGPQGAGPGQFREPTAIAVDCEHDTLYVVDVTGFSVFDSRDGHFVRSYPRPPGFSNRGSTALVLNGSLYTTGIWPRDMSRNWRDTDPDTAHAGARFGLKLDLTSGEATPVFEPVDLGCRSFASSCWESSFDRISAQQEGWVFSQVLSSRVALSDPATRIVRTVDVRTPRFQTDDQVIPPTAPLEQHIAWAERNSMIYRVFAFADRVAVIHIIQTTRGWRRGSLIKYGVFLNTYRMDGTIIASDLELPDLPVGRDDQHVYVVDYGAQGKREEASSARLVAIRVVP